LFLSNDMPFVSADLLRRLKARFKRGVKSLFMADAEFVGFPFLLSRNVLPTVAKQISDERYSLQELARAVGARLVRVTPRYAADLFNINTPADWVVARQRWRRLRRKSRS
jgi:CTP:molybdopterin cytidylyltransferase MocA